LGDRFRIRHAVALGTPIAGAGLLAVLLLPEEALAVEFGDGLRSGFGGIGLADVRWLVVMGLLLACSLTGSALAWREGLRDAVQRTRRGGALRGRVARQCRVAGAGRRPDPDRALLPARSR
jgi:hypothetical protein